MKDKSKSIIRDTVIAYKNRKNLTFVNQDLRSDGGIPLEAIPDLELENELLKALGIEDAGMRPESVTLLLCMGYQEDQELEGGLVQSAATTTNDLVLKQEGHVIGFGPQAYKRAQFLQLEPRFYYGATIHFNNFTNVPRVVTTKHGFKVRLGMVRDVEIIASYADSATVEIRRPVNDV